MWNRSQSCVCDDSGGREAIGGVCREPARHDEARERAPVVEFADGKVLLGDVRLVDSIWDAVRVEEEADVLASAF